MIAAFTTGHLAALPLSSMEVLESQDWRVKLFTPIHSTQDGESPPAPGPTVGVGGFPAICLALWNEFLVILEDLPLSSHPSTSFASSSSLCFSSIAKF